MTEKDIDKIVKQVKYNFSTNISNKNYYNIIIWKIDYELVPSKRELFLFTWKVAQRVPVKIK